MRCLYNITILLGLSIFVAGCTQTTTGIWQPPTYREVINQFLISENDSRLVIIGDKYHYIFDSNDNIDAILSWDGRTHLHAKFIDEFVLDDENNIYGDFEVLCSCEGVTEEQAEWLKINGFSRIKYSEGSDCYRIHIKVSGVRFLAGDVKVNDTRALNDHYSITVRTPRTPGSVIGAVALTPIAVAEDGVATLGLGALLVVAAPFALVGTLVNGD